MVADRRDRRLVAPPRILGERARAGLVGGIAVYLAPLGSPAYAALFAERLLTPPAWSGRDGSTEIPYRRPRESDRGEIVRARHPRARHAALAAASGARVGAARDESRPESTPALTFRRWIPDLKPDRVVTATDLARDGLRLPAFYGDAMLLAEGRMPAYLGQAAADLIFP